MALILVRHPQPLVAQGVCYGRIDLAVAPGQLEQTLATLSSTLPPGLPLYSSPLQRCATLATRLAPAPMFDARLMEMDFGDWEMRRWDDIPRTEIDAWAADLAHYRPGGGETVLEMATRIAAFHTDLLHQLGERGTDSAIVICHAGAIRLLAARHAGLPPEDMALQAARSPHQIPYGATLML